MRTVLSAFFWIGVYLALVLAFGFIFLHFLIIRIDNVDALVIYMRSLHPPHVVPELENQKLLGYSLSQAKPCSNL